MTAVELPRSGPSVLVVASFAPSCSARVIGVVAPSHNLPKAMANPALTEDAVSPRCGRLGLDLNGIRVLDDCGAWLLLWWPGARHKHHQHHDDERGVHGNRDSDLGCLWLLMGLRRQWFHWIRHVRWQLRLQPLDDLDMKMWGDSGLPALVFAAFQMTFAIISSAIISGSLVERMRFSAYCIMLALWSLLIYATLCHWVWGPGGWIGEDGSSGLRRWNLWFTLAPVCPALLPVASLDHAGTWRRIWALPTSLS